MFWCGMSRLLLSAFLLPSRASVLPSKVDFARLLAVLPFSAWLNGGGVGRVSTIAIDVSRLLVVLLRYCAPLCAKGIVSLHLLGASTFVKFSKNLSLAVGLGLCADPPGGGHLRIRGGSVWGSVSPHLLRYFSVGFQVCSADFGASSSICAGFLAAICCWARDSYLWLFCLSIFGVSQVSILVSEPFLYRCVVYASVFFDSV